tara:strand:+ start:419 stop:574 length:156 start_codon:yes stop_codon:yes gene_type:complete
MGGRVIALKNVKACTVLPMSQKKKKIVEQKCQKKINRDGVENIKNFLRDEL